MRLKLRAAYPGGSLVLGLGRPQTLAGAAVQGRQYHVFDG